MAVGVQVMVSNYWWLLLQLVAKLCVADETSSFLVVFCDHHPKKANQHLVWGTRVGNGELELDLGERYSAEGMEESLVGKMGDDYGTLRKDLVESSLLEELRHRFHLIVAGSTDSIDCEPVLQLNHKIFYVLRAM